MSMTTREKPKQQASVSVRHLLFGLLPLTQRESIARKDKRCL